MKIGRREIKHRQTWASDEEIEQLKTATGIFQTNEAIREAILRTIKNFTTGA